jgi:hypothetical protein
MIRKWLENRPNKWQREPSRFGSLADFAPIVIALILTLIGLYLAVGPSPFAGLKIMQPQPVSRSGGAAAPASDNHEAGALLFHARPAGGPAKPAPKP